MFCTRNTAAVLYFFIAMLVSVAALGCSETVSASDPDADRAAAEVAWAGRVESGEVVTVQAAGELTGLTGKAIDLPAVQSYCRAQSDQHYDDCVTVRQVLDALAGDCQDCRSALGYRYSLTTGRVVRIDLDSKDLAGSIPTEIGELTALELLSLSNNDLTGAIPSQIGNLTALEWMLLSRNELTGSIPSQIGNLARLGSLWLPSNQLTGPIPPEIGNLTNLQNLSLFNNQLTGPIPPELGNLTNLTYLTLDNNQLTGCVPASLQEAYSGDDYPICGASLQTPFNLPAAQSHCRAQSDQHYDDCVTVRQVLDALAGDCEDCRSALGYRYSLTTGRVVRIDLDSKDLAGSIPTEIGELTALELLSLSNNDLTGAIPSQIGNLTALEWMLLSRNELTGSIPSQIGNLARLGSLWLSSNQLTGPIPPEIGNLTNLQNLSLFNNQLTGPIPPELGNLTNLTYLTLDNNQLTGCVPASLQEAYSGDDYPICEASLQTPIPTTSPTPASTTPTPTPTPTAAPTSSPTTTPTPAPLPDTCGSAVTDKSNTGLVADCNALLAARDTLRGTAALNWAPDTAITRWDGIRLSGSPKRVAIVRLQKKGLSGQIPAALGRLDALEELWLYDNALTGAIPSELGGLANLRWLFVSTNKLRGQIPETLNNLSLDRLWLHQNDFTGCVPYNLTLTGEYKVDRGLPACAPPTGSSTPTPTPAPTAPTPTPTPMGVAPTTLDLSNLENANCSAKDLSDAFGGTYTRKSVWGPFRWERNGEGWLASLHTRWEDSEDGDIVECLTVVYDGMASQILNDDYGMLRRWTEYDWVVMQAEKPGGGLTSSAGLGLDPSDIGDPRTFKAMLFGLGYYRPVSNPSGRGPYRKWVVAAGLFSRGEVTVMVSGWANTEKFNPALAGAVKAPYNDVVEALRLIDSRREGWGLP